MIFLERTSKNTIERNALFAIKLPLNVQKELEAICIEMGMRADSVDWWKKKKPDDYGWLLALNLAEWEGSDRGFLRGPSARQIASWVWVAGVACRVDVKLPYDFSGEPPKKKKKWKFGFYRG